MEFHLGEEFDSETRIDSLLEFIEFWMGERRPEFGTPVTDNRELMPPSLLRIIEFAGDWPRIPDGKLLSNQNYLVDSVALTDEGKIHVVFENQSVCGWVTEARQEDPSVWAKWNDSDHWHVVSESLTSFLIIHCLFEICSGSRLALFDSALEGALEGLESNDLAILRGFNPDEKCADEYRFTLVEGVVIRMDSPFIDPLFAAQSARGVDLLNRYRSWPNSLRIVANGWEYRVGSSGTFEVNFFGGAPWEHKNASALGEIDPSFVRDVSEKYFLRETARYDRESCAASIQFFTGSSTASNHIPENELSPFVARLISNIAVRGDDYDSYCQRFPPVH